MKIQSQLPTKILVAIIVLLSFGTPFGCKKKPASPPAVGSKAEKREIPPSPPGEGRTEDLSILTSPGDGGAVRNLRQPLVVRFSRAVDPASFSFKIDPNPGG